MGHVSEGFAAALPFLPNKPVIIDGGANTGMSSEEFLSVRIQSRIYAFEPDPRAFAELEKQKFKGSVSRNQMALSDYVGVGQMHLGDEKHSYVSSLHHRIDGLECFPLTSAVDVPCTTLDYYSNAKGIEFIDLLKLDLQGGELHALHGAEGLMNDLRIGVILTEVWMLPSYRGSPRYWEIAKYLQGYGFETWWIGTVQYPDPAEGRWGDAVFVHESLLKKTLKMEFKP